VSKCVFTAASRLPKRAAVAGMPKAGLLLSFSRVPRLRSPLSLKREILLPKLWDTHSRRPWSTRPSALGALMPLMSLEAPVRGLIV
jgi:hypothetical protein